MFVGVVGRFERDNQHLLRIADGVPGDAHDIELGGSKVDTESATGKLTLSISAAMAQFEHKMMIERQHEGIHKAKRA